MKEYSTEGTHIIVDLWGVDSVLLDNVSYIKDLLKFAIAKSGATFISLQEKKFSPVGLTVVCLLEESHMSIHSSPEHEYAAIDLFTCGSANPDIAIDYIIQRLQPKEVYRQSLIRGVK